MPYKKKFPMRRRRTFSRYKKKRTFASKSGRNMQRMALSFVKKKYTTVLPITMGIGEDLAQLTISHIGARNSTTPGNTTVLTDCDPDQMATEDMKLYQFFKISGVAFKLFWPEGTEAASTPVQWSMGYSSNQVINPAVVFGRLQALQTYQTSSCSARAPVSRFFRTGQTLKRLGIDWVNTKEYSNFGANPPVATGLYGGQLPVNAGSSTNIKVYRSASANTTKNQVGRIQITYYVTYKGAKGTGTLV